MDRGTMRLAILSAAREWREDANNRLPYGLCKKYGIEVPPGTTPREAWELLKKHGIDPDGAYRRTAESWERQKAEQRAAKKTAGKQSPQKGKEGPSEAAGKRKEAGDKAKREAEEKARKEAEKKAERETEEQAKREAEEKARKEAEEKAKQETEEKAPREGGTWPEPERLEPWKLRTAMDAETALRGRCGCPTDRMWREGVCDSAKKEIAGAIVALDGRYHALDPDHNEGWPILVTDGDGPWGAIAAAGECSDGTTACLKFYHRRFGSEETYAATKARAKEESGDGRKMPIADGMEAAYLAAHEYGHCVQRRMMRDTDVFRPDGRWRITEEESEELSLAAAWEMQAEIMRLAREIEPESPSESLIKDGGCISAYGSKDPYEFFAECFANSVCGKPNALGRAMAAFLERHIAGDGSREKYRK